MFQAKDVSVHRFNQDCPPVTHIVKLGVDEFEVQIRSDIEAQVSGHVLYAGMVYEITGYLRKAGMGWGFVNAKLHQDHGNKKVYQSLIAGVSDQLSCWFADNERLLNARLREFFHWQIGRKHEEIMQINRQLDDLGTRKYKIRDDIALLESEIRDLDSIIYADDEAAPSF